MNGTGTVTAIDPAVNAQVSKKKYVCSGCGHARFTHSCTYNNNCHHPAPGDVNNISCHMVDCGCGGFC